MKNKTNDRFGVESLVQNWAQSMNDMVGILSQTWSAYQKSQPSGQQTQDKAESDMFATMTSAVKSWQTIASAMTTPESIASYFKGSDAIPDISVKFTQAIINSFMDLQSKISQSVDRLGESVEGFRFEKPEENIFNTWSEIYEKEFQKFFQIPQLGLAREYQERFNKMMDKFHLFQASYSEFLRMLAVPFQRSMQMVQEEITNLAETGELPDSSQEYYQMWIKTLEGHFMTLFQTSEYIEALTKTVSTLSRFSEAKDAVIEDLIKGFPVALKSEMDDLAKEVHELKRRLRRLEKGT